MKMVNRDEIIWFSIGAYFLLGVIGVGVFDINSQLWEVSGFIAGTGFLGFLITFFMMMAKTPNARTYEEVK